MLNNAGKFYPYEMAYRLTGEQHYQLVEEQRKIDLAKMMIKLCINEDISGYDTEAIDSNNFYQAICKFSSFIKPGEIAQIRGLDILEKLTK